MPTSLDHQERTEADVAEKIADCLEDCEAFPTADWNDLGEVTVWHRGRVYRMTVHDITDEGS